MLIIFASMSSNTLFITYACNRTDEDYDKDMAEILLVRHAKSYANKQDFTVFGNEDSPLEDEKGIPQAIALNGLFKQHHGISPESYSHPVLASKYVRPQQTAQYAGFEYIDASELINESNLERAHLSGKDAIAKHARERWVPDETKERAIRLIECVRSGELAYEIYFTHGLFIAAVMLQLSDEAEIRGYDFPHVFGEKRGYIPDLATVTSATI